MISNYTKIFCKEDISLIENYEQAVNDKTQIWDCHHRLEIELNLSRDELKERDLYYNRPASELILLTHAEHQKLHNNVRFKDPKEREKFKGEKNPFYNKHHDEEMRNTLSEINTDARWMNNGITRVYALKDRIEHYLERGYVFGYKLK